jgi:flagellar basal-body rod modification protein FlgD
MTTSAVTNNTAAAAATTSSTDKAAASSVKLSQTFDTFLTMLTTQLKHQDPLSPMDSTQFTNQLVQFSAVEQQINANSNLQQLIGLQKTNQVASAISYLGQTVEVSGSDLPLQNGKASFSYTLPEAAHDISIAIKDAAGHVVGSMPAVDPAAGRHEMSWNGKDSSGNQLADGKYSISLVANNSDGNPIDATTTVYGKVTDLAPDDTNGTLLGIGQVVSTIGNVLTVRDTASLQAAQTTSSKI